MMLNGTTKRSKRFHEEKQSISVKEKKKNNLIYNGQLIFVWVSQQVKCLTFMYALILMRIGTFAKCYFFHCISFCLLERFLYFLQPGIHIYRHVKAHSFREYFLYVRFFFFFLLKITVFQLPI